MAKAVFQAGPQAGTEAALDKSTLFGRQSACNVVLTENMSSRQHFVIERFNGLYCVRDMQSRNGTRVNGKKVKQALLNDGDVIRVGETEIKIVYESSDNTVQSLLGDRYEILERIGEGGMGIVFKAKQLSMDRLVALKILSPRLAVSQVYVKRFLEEARAAGRLNHPNIVQVHDVDTVGGLYFFSMEYVEGATCQELLEKSGIMPENDALEVTRQVAKALQYAHDHGLVHRDIKPDNIMVGDGGSQIKLADLGISKALDSDGQTKDETSAHERKVIGTPAFISPEAARADRVGPASDLYSLGATLFVLLAGRSLFDCKDPKEMLKAHVTEAPPDIRKMNAAVSADTARLIADLLKKDPEDRPASAQAVLEAATSSLNKLGSGPATRLGETLMLRNMAAGNFTKIEQPSPGSSTPGGQQPNNRPPARRRTNAGRRKTKSWITIAMQLSILAVALIVAFLFKDVFIDIYNKLQNKPEALEEVQDDTQNTTTTVTQNETTVEDTTNTDNATLTDAERQAINTGLSTAGAAINEDRYDDAEAALQGLNAKDDALLAERLASMRDQISSSRERWHQRTQDALNRAIRKSDAAEVDAILANAHGDATIAQAAQQAKDAIAKTQAADAAAIKNRAYQLLQEWRLQTFHEHLASQAALPGELKKLGDEVKKVEESIAGMATAMRNNKITFQSTLSGMQRPRLARCDVNKIFLETADGMAVGINWSKLNSNEIDLVMLQTIGKAKMQDYSNAWSRLLAIAGN